MPARIYLQRFDAIAFTSQMWFFLFLYGWGATIVLAAAVMAVNHPYMFISDPVHVVLIGYTLGIYVGGRALCLRVARKCGLWAVGAKRNGNQFV